MYHLRKKFNLLADMVPGRDIYLQDKGRDGTFFTFWKQTNGLVNKIEKNAKRSFFLIIITKLNRFTPFLKSKIELAEKN